MYDRLIIQVYRATYIKIRNLHAGTLFLESEDSKKENIKIISLLF